MMSKVVCKSDGCENTDFERSDLENDQVEFTCKKCSHSFTVSKVPLGDVFGPEGDWNCSEIRRTPQDTVRVIFNKKPHHDVYTAEVSDECVVNWEPREPPSGQEYLEDLATSAASDASRWLGSVR